MTRGVFNRRRLTAEASTAERPVRPSPLDHPSQSASIRHRSTARPSYLIVACTVMTDVPEGLGPLPVALMAKVSFPLYLAFVLYS